MIWDVVGWTSNACFFSRFFVQWLVSERARRVETPAAFWWLSLAGATCLSAYTVQVGQPVLAVGALINGSIAARNLWLQRHPCGERAPSLVMVAIVLACVPVLIATQIFGKKNGWDPTSAWGIAALIGQAAWSSRFVLQWWFAERERRSHFPPAFWYLSLVGNGLLLPYALHLGNAVLIAAYLPGPIIQVRNLILSSTRQTRAEAA